MKKQLLISFVLALTCGILNSQNLIRVNNNPDMDADYASLVDAVDNASEGDTIHLEGSTEIYDGVAIEKPLIIIGTGYFLSENPKTQASKYSTEINGGIYFNAGSEGSVISGCKINNYIYVNADDIIVKRCHVNNIRFDMSCENVFIMQNYIYYNISTQGAVAVNNSIISNNIITQSINISTYGGSNQILNNVIVGNNNPPYPLYCYNSSVHNNICCYSGGTIIEDAGNTVTNNIFAADGTNANGNQYNVDINTVFADYDETLDYSTDGKWQLKVGSPAIGAGTGGVDCGAFGGIIPYVLSGIPNVPHIYEATVPGTILSNEDLSVTIKIKSGD